MSYQISQNELDIFKSSYGTSGVDALNNNYHNTPSVPNYTLGDLENNKQFQEDAEVYLDYLSTNTTGWRNFLTLGNYGSNDDIFETLRDEDYRLTDAITGGRRNTLKKAPEEVKKAYARLRKTFDTADIGEGHYFNAIKDVSADIFSDPITIASLILSRGASLKGIGTGAKGRTVAQTLQKLGLNNTTKQTAFLEGLYGASEFGLTNYNTQSMEQAAGLRNMIDGSEIAKSTAMGGALGYGVSSLLSYGLTKASNKGKRASKDLMIITDPDELGSIKASDIDPDIADIADDYSKTGKYTILPDGTIDLDESQFGDFVETLGAKIDVTDENTKGALKDAVLISIQEHAGATGKSTGSYAGFEGLTFRKILHGTLPKVLMAGKVAGVLDAYVPYSNTAKILAKKFRYDLARDFFQEAGSTQKEARDYAEVFTRYQGDRLTRMKRSMEKVTLNIKGQNLEDMQDILVRILRGDKIQPGTTQPYPDEILDAAKGMRDVFDEIAVDLKGYGIMDDAVENYFPRMWDRDSLIKNETAFKKDLVDNQVKFRAGKQEILINNDNVDQVFDDLIDKKNQLDVAGTSRSFFSKRSFIIDDDTLFQDYLDNNLDAIINSYTAHTAKSIAKARVFGVSNGAEFNDVWINRISNEMKESIGRTLTQTERQKILNIWNSQTGEGYQRFSTNVDNASDWYILINRLALLPLATVSSISEIGINISKGGVLNFGKGLGKALAVGTRNTTDALLGKLIKNYKISRTEAFREMNSVGIALEQAAVDGAARLSGGELRGSKQRTINNAFFKLNLLEWWTKTVQLASFTTAKELINDNLGAIAAKGLQNPNRRTKLQIDQLNELGLDVEKGLEWYKAGAKKDDPFYQNDILESAGRYTNEVILQPTTEAGIKPAFMSDPKLAIFTQLLGYPSAFTNIVLKNFARDTLGKGDIKAGANTLGAVLGMTGIAYYTNYVRSHGENVKDKDTPELIRDSVARWGGNGLLFDMHRRGSKAAEAYQNIALYPTGFLGPIGGDVAKAIIVGPSQAFGPKFTLGAYTTAPVVGLDDFQDDIDEKLKAVDDFLDEAVEKRDRRDRLNQGGILEFFKVPNTPEIPRQRVDKMTGVPYDEQAGEIIERLQFGIGSKVLRNVIKKYSKDISEEQAEQAEKMLRERARVYQVSPEEETEILADRTKAILEGRAFTNTNEDVDIEIENVLDELNLRETPEDAFINAQAKVRHTEDLTKTDQLGKDINFYKDEVREELKSLKERTDPDIQVLMRDYSRMVNRMPRTARPMEDASSYSRDKTQESLASFIKDSVVQEPVYRSTGHGLETDFEINFAFPREIGPHFGTRDQADIATLKFNIENERELSRKIQRGQTTLQKSFKEMVAEPNKIPATSKGYLNIKNPLYVEEDFGNWSPDNIYTSTKKFDTFTESIAKDTGVSELTIEKEIMAALTGPMKRLERIRQNLRDEFDNVKIGDPDVYYLAIKLAENSLNDSFRRYLKSKGYDGIAYRNKAESKKQNLFLTIREQEQIQAGTKDEYDYSYIPFEPEQFKMSTAGKFDPNDPRAFKYGGSKIINKLKQRGTR